MGPLAIDEQGNVYIAPVPFVNVLENKSEDQNKLYTINTQTGIMSELINLGGAAGSTQLNGFGIMGLNYDCDNHLLYVSSIYGSDNKTERGALYCIDVKESPAKIIDKYEGVDAIGIGVAYFNDKKRVFYGGVRDHAVHSIELKENGGFTTNNRLEFSMNNIGPRGDDVVKKIRFTPQGEMLVTGVEFYYNLTAPTQKQESLYTYMYDMSKSAWVKTKEENKNLIIGF